jgi:hypothetical protein
VDGSCENGDEPAGSCATELVSLVGYCLLYLTDIVAYNIMLRTLYYVICFCSNCLLDYYFMSQCNSTGF